MRILIAILGIGCAAFGVLCLVLGIWGLDRRGNGAWILVLVGLLSCAAGAAALRWATRQERSY